MIFIDGYALFFVFFNSGLPAALVFKQSLPASYSIITMI